MQSRPAPTSPPRRHARHPIQVWASALSDEQELECLITNISLGGLRLENLAAAPGELLRLRFTLPQLDGQCQNVELFGTVRWTDGKSAGIDFGDLSDARDFAAIYAAVAVLQ